MFKLKLYLKSLGEEMESLFRAAIMMGVPVEAISRLRNLLHRPNQVTVDLSGSYVADQDISLVSDILSKTKIEALVIRGSNIKENAASIAKISTLKNLNLQFNFMTKASTYKTIIQGLKRLTTLDISINILDDDCVKEVLNSPRLRSLTIDVARLTPNARRFFLDNYILTELIFWNMEFPEARQLQLHILNNKMLRSEIWNSTQTLYQLNQAGRLAHLLIFDIIRCLMPENASVVMRNGAECM